MLDPSLGEQLPGRELGSRASDEDVAGDRQGATSDAQDLIAGDVKVLADAADKFTWTGGRSTVVIPVAVLVAKERDLADRITRNHR